MSRALQSLTSTTPKTCSLGAVDRDRSARRRPADVAELAFEVELGRRRRARRRRPGRAGGAPACRSRRRSTRGRGSRPGAVAVVAQRRTPGTKERAEVRRVLARGVEVDVVADADGQHGVAGRQREAGVGRDGAVGDDLQQALAQRAPGGGPSSISGVEVGLVQRLREVADRASSAALRASASTSASSPCANGGRGAPPSRGADDAPGRISCFYPTGSARAAFVPAQRVARVVELAGERRQAQRRGTCRT